MRKLGITILAITLASMLQAQSITGDWHGTLNVSGIKLRLVFHIQEAGDGYTATMDSPDQGANGIPVETVELQADNLIIALPAYGIRYEGKLAADGSAVKGTFHQGPGSFPFEMGRTAQEKVVVQHPQEPKPPFPYREEHVQYANQQAEGVSLAGTLTLPEGDGPFPAVILISGSGPQDRNEEMLGHKPFLVIADHFTRAGIAVLRFDDRGVGKSTGNFREATSVDFASDVQAGIDFLKTRPEINAGQIGLAGHSEGGLIGPIVAADNADVAFLIMMAGPGVNGEEILLLQQDLMATAEGSSAEEIAMSRRMSEKIFLDMRRSDDLEQTKKDLIVYLKEEMHKLPAADKEKLGDLDKLAEQQIGMLFSPWFRYFLTYEPADKLQKVRCPVLAINGSRDLQVDAEQNLPAIAAALKKGGNKRVTTKVLPGLNHLFQHSETGKGSEYGELSETFAPEVLELMTAWIKQQL